MNLNLSPELREAVMVARDIKDFLVGFTGCREGSIDEFRYQVQAVDSVAAGACIVKEELYLGRMDLDEAILLLVNLGERDNRTATVVDEDEITTPV